MGWPDAARLLPLAGCGLALAWALTARAGAGGALLALSAAVTTTGAVWASRSRQGIDRSTVDRVAIGSLLVLPALLAAYFCFTAGGYFPAPVAAGALVLAIALVARCALAAQPLRALGPRALVPIVALAGFAGWVQLSAQWSDAPGRAIVELDRALLYLFAFVLCASLANGPGRLAVGVRLLAGALTLVAGAALLSRLAPDVLDTGQLSVRSRLAYPLSYWNALGVLCALAGVLCLHVCADTAGPRVLRVTSAGALPVLGTTLFLTFSRGGAAAAVLGVVAYAVLGRPRALLPALAAVAAPTFYAVHEAYGATLLASDHPTSPPAVVQGHAVGHSVLLAVLAAVVVRGALVLAVDGRLDRLRLPDRLRRPVTVTAWAAFVVAVMVAAAAAHAPTRLSAGWDQFAHQASVGATSNVRDRFGSVSNQGRLEHWRTAMKGYEARPLQGNGAGTFVELWDQHRRTGGDVTDAHSLYAETLGEMGLVGLALIALVVLGTLAGLAPIRRGRDRPLYAAVFAMVLAWAAHAGLDWDWEVPAVTLSVFVLGGLALGRATESEGVRASRARRLAPAAVGLAALALAAVPALVLASQTHVDNAVDDFVANDCPGAVREAGLARDVLAFRPQPYEIAAVCAARAERVDRALPTLRQALGHDPGNWRLHAWTAAAIAANGGDPWAEIRQAVRLNPLDPVTTNLRETFATSREDQWQRAGGRYLREKVLPER